ncbi:propanediol utilization phosphotransacylase [Clostridium polyendosporum]|uniref:Phosphate propanoyltransferase n=1 Tax=Clostridium polyendosporum TaxID=69208 RepID=A0A919VH21_9CLOT|nr:phosphate propanoyltransferase [Clostridium polyendosporum]GIM29792.1 propanediol utilization phosphotransacylase [Clostridium polyendosporum]
MDNLQTKETINYITELVLKEVTSLGFKLQKERNKVPVSISARHLHLNREHLDLLFGIGYELTKVKDISQPGQFAAEEKVTLVGSRGRIDNVRVLGPLREETQVEISATDARVLGIEPIVRNSGNHEGTPGLVIVGPKGILNLKRGCIVVERHIHMTPEDAVNFGVSDGQKVCVKVDSIRGGILDNVFVRVQKDFALDMHIDVDDSNAFLIKNGDMLEILK